MYNLNGLGPDLDTPGSTARLPLGSVCSPTFVFGTVDGAQRFTSTQRQMHFVYTIDAKCWRPNGGNLGGSDPAGVIELRFSIAGGHCLNWPGTLYLADGDPDDTYLIHIVKRDIATPCFHWHWLAAQTIDGVPYVAPQFHSHWYYCSTTFQTAPDYTNAGLTGLAGPLVRLIGDNREISVRAGTNQIVTGVFA